MSVPNLRKYLMIHQPVGRELKCVVRDTEPKLHAQLSRYVNYAERLHIALGLPNHGCEACGKPTKFLSLYKGHKRFCSKTCANRCVHNHKDKPSRERIDELEHIFIKNVDVTPKMYWRVLTSKYRKFMEDTARHLHVEPKRVIYHMFVSPRLGTCSTCGEPTKFISLRRGYTQHCSSVCSHQDPQKQLRRKRTCRAKYGTDHAWQAESVKRKIRRTCRKNHGVSYSMQSPIVKRKARATWVKRYGVDNPGKSSEIKDKVEKTCLRKYGVDNVFKSERVKAKIRNTCMRNYGVANPMQSAEVRRRSDRTCLRKYGFTNPLKNKRVYQKVKRTCLARYGVTHPTRCPSVQAKRRKTCLARYGYDHPNKNSYMFNKNCYRIRDFRYQGRSYRVMGYEDVAIRGLIDRGFKIAKHTPAFHYFCRTQKKMRVYHPDMYVMAKSGKKYIIEVKSPYTSGITMSDENNRLWTNLVDKARGVETSGSSFVLMIVNNDKVIHIGKGIPRWEESK